jgi:hypothetical protein
MSANPAVAPRVPTPHRSTLPNWETGGYQSPFLTKPRFNIRCE